MSLLHEIQEAVVREGVDLASVLLKMRLLASRLGSEYLEDWVKHESEGYPADIEVPDYRKVGVTYKGTFSGPFGSGIRNAPIPPHLIKKYAGERWIKIEIRESVGAIDELVKSTADNEGSLGIDASNLILMLQGKVYGQYACNDISAEISRTALSEIQQAVRSRVLELTIELEKNVPEATEIRFGASQDSVDQSSEKVQQISQQIIYGNVTTALAGGQGHSFNITIGVGDTEALVDYLEKAGVSRCDAEELAEIMKSEKPESPEEPFGRRAQSWLTENLRKAGEGVWNLGITTATKVISEAALKYYGLK
jgi:hypothetical protein